MTINALIKNTKIEVRCLRNLFRDIANRHLFYFPKKDGKTYTYDNKISLTQNLNPNDAKVHNLNLAINKIARIHILPGQIFSFWQIVGKPSKRNGFTESRSIVGNRIENAVGGGLCQLSGLIYYLSLGAGLEILERYNHSMDIYDETTRFTPIGSDATVAYGYKDLKIRNNHTSAIHFTFLMEPHLLTIELNHNGHINRKEVTFEVTKMTPTEVVVQTLVDREMVTESKYKLLAKT